MASLQHFLLVFYYWIRSIILCFVPRNFLYKDISKDTVLITGAGNGLGRTLAIEMSKYVSRLVLWDIDEVSVKQTASAIKNDGVQCYYYRVDVTDADAVYETARKVKREVGKVDILVNNAGVVSGKRFLDLTEKDVEKTFKVNTLAHIWLCKAFLPEMIAENRGHIVTVTSVGSYTAGYQVSDYVGSKFAATGVFESLATEMKQEGYDGIKFTLVSPYLIATDMFRGASPEFFDALDPGYVSQEIIKAIRSNQEFLVVPNIFKVVLLLCAVMPFSSRYALFVALGYDKLMNKFTGHSAGSDNTESPNSH